MHYSQIQPVRKLHIVVLLSLMAMVASLTFFGLGGLLRAQDSTTIEFPENGEGPVATFTAADPEGATPIYWDLVAGNGDPDSDGDLEADDNADADDFSIDRDGVLKFNIADANDGDAPGSPDYENPQGAGTPPNNTYNVVVVACDVPLESEACPATGKAGYHKVTVKVTKVDEKGKITWTVGADGTAPGETDVPQRLLQFQDGAILTATATDGDILGATKTVASPRLKWYRSPTKTGMGTAIKGATGATYTVGGEDIGMYIRVDAFYNVGTGREESASLISDYPVLADQTSNDVPEFSQTDIKRSISEGDKGRNVGAQVTATDDITNALNYTLAGVDRERFKIDQKTGQIATKLDLNYDETSVGTDGGSENQCVERNSCVVTVTATDSAGGASSPVATVTIKITNVDEKPTFTTGFRIRDVMEGMTQVDNDADATNDPAGEAIYAATDPDGKNVNLTLTGDDASKFSLSAADALSFKEKPDYETPTDRNRDNVYEVTVRATDDDGTTEDRAVRVTVINVDEEPDITGKNSFTHEENSADAVATFTAADPEGATPIYWDLVAGNGDPDSDGDLEADDNADADDFSIDRDGVLKFNIADANDGDAPGSPDYENPQGAGTPPNNTYNVVVVACDVPLESEACPATGKAGYHKVTVKVTKVDEKGKITWTVGADGTAPGETDVPQRLLQFQDGAILTATATDGDILGATKTVAENVTWRWYRGSTAIKGATGATYTVGGEDIGKRIKVEVGYTVSSGQEESASLISDYPVLADQTSNDVPEFSQTDIKRSISEGDKGRNVGAQVTATDDITNALNYTLAGVDRERFKIDQKTGQIATKLDLNYDETSVGTDGGSENQCVERNSCVVTVTATDSAGGASSPVATVTIKITNVDEKPTFTTGFRMRDVMEGMTQVDNDADATNDPAGEAIYAATDPDGKNVNLTLTGDDASKFSLSAADALSFKEKPDYETPTDRNRDNVYEVTVRATDDDGTTEDRAVRVTVTDVDEGPEIMASVAGIYISGKASVSYAENGTDAVGTYTARGEDAARARWTLEGADRGDFTLSRTSGTSTMLRFSSPPNYEAPADADTNNVYMVTLKATAGGEMDTHEVTVRVTDVDETQPPHGQTLLQRYDADNSGGVDKSEMIKAINDYLFGEGDDAINKEDMIVVINLYLFS